MLYRATFKTPDAEGEFKVEAKNFPDALSQSGNLLNSTLKSGFASVESFRLVAYEPPETTTGKVLVRKLAKEEVK